MKGVLYYFSGTGNTKWAADKFKEYFKEYKVDLKLVNIESTEVIDIKSYDFIVIGSPVYSKLHPKIVEDFLNRLSDTRKNINTIIYTTQGTKSAAAATIISRKMKKKGYEVIIKTCIQMPNNYYFAMGKEPTLKEQDEILKLSDEKIKYLVKSFMAESRVSEDIFFIRLELGKVSGRFLKKSLPRLSQNITSTNECIKCGLCLRNCPKNNITFENGHAVFHSKCMLCLRCIYICPQNAVRYKGKKINQIQKERINKLNLIK